jgi:hypothetical protein
MKPSDGLIREGSQNTERSRQAPFRILLRNKETDACARNA